MAKMYRHNNQCNASVQYFVIKHADKYCTLSKKHETEMRFALSFIHKNKRRSIMRQSLRQITYVERHMSIVVRQNHCVVVPQKLWAIR